MNLYVVLTAFNGAKGDWDNILVSRFPSTARPLGPWDLWTRSCFYVYGLAKVRKGLIGPWLVQNISVEYSKFRDRLATRKLFLGLAMSFVYDSLPSQDDTRRKDAAAYNGGQYLRPPHGDPVTYSSSVIAN